MMIWNDDDDDVDDDASNKSNGRPMEKMVLCFFDNEWIFDTWLIFFANEMLLTRETLVTKKKMKI